MTRDTNPVDARLREELLDTLDDVARQAHWNEVVARRSTPIDAPARRPRRRHMRILAIAIALVLVGGGALAVGADGLLSTSDDDAPTTHRIDQFQRDDVERATTEEYEQLQASTMVPGVKRIGIIEDSEMKQLYELAPIERSRVVADDPKVGRVVAVPSADDANTCFLITAPAEKSDAGIGGHGGCTHQLPATGVGLTYGHMGTPGATRYLVSGFAADDVDRVQIDLADGRRVDATLVTNAVYWSELGTDSTSRAVQVVTTRGNRTCFEDVDFLHRTKPPAKPHCETTADR